MILLSRLSRAAVAVTAATVLGSTLAVTGAVLSGPARAAAGIDTSSQSAFLRSIAPLAQEGQRAYRVPASVAMAQAILESGWGKSTLTTRGNAFFGIKCSRVMGPYATGCLNMRTREVFNGSPTYIIDGFRTYDDPVDSFKDHGRFLTVNSRYSAAFNYPNDPKRFVAEVHRAGYATDPTYTAMIVQLMNQFDLYRYDTLPAATASASRTPSRTPSAALTETASAVPSSTAPIASSARPSSSPSATTTSELPTVVPSTRNPTPTPNAVTTEPSAGPGRVPYAIPTPSASSSALPSASSTTPTPTASPAARTASPSATTTRTVASAIVPTPTLPSSIEAPERQPSVGDGVVPDPSMEPSTTSSENLSSPTGSAPAKSVEAAPVDPLDVRATEPQDQAKAGALFPDGTQVTVTGLHQKEVHQKEVRQKEVGHKEVRQKERHGGLANTGL